MIGQVVIVTGASRGIGKQIAIELGRRGASVVAARTGEQHGRLPDTIGETVDVMAQRGMDVSEAIPMDVPMQAIAYLATCDDPMRSTGSIMSAEEMVASGEVT